MSTFSGEALKMGVCSLRSKFSSLGVAPVFNCCVVLEGILEVLLIFFRV